MNILVTGGTKGIGKAVALRFSAPGNKVFLNYFHDDHAANAAKAEVAAIGATPILLKYNVGDIHQVREMSTVIKSEVDSIDLIVHCATGIVRGNSLEIPPEEWRKAVEISSLSLIDIVREVRPLLIRGSNIIALSSKGATSAIPHYAALGTTKAFTHSIIQYMAKELAPHGIRANIVAAGPIDTEAFRTMFGDSAKARLEAAAKANPSGRNITFDDITETIYGITKPELQMIQGQVVFVDGGLYL